MDVNTQPQEQEATSQTQDTAQPTPEEDNAATDPAVDPLAPLPDDQKSESDGKEDGEGEKSIDDLPLPEEESTSKKEKLPKWIEKKLLKKDRELKDAIYEKELLRQKMTAAPQDTNINSSQPAYDPNAPTREQFATEDEFIDARIDYKNRKNFDEFNQKKQAADYVESERKFIKKFDDIRESGSKKYEDFDEKTDFLFSPAFPGNRPMSEAIVDSKYKEDIVYFLGMYPEEAEKIARMEPVKAIKKIAEIESRFKASMEKKSTTNAPAVVKPLGGSSGTATEPTVKQVENMQMDEYEKWYKSKFN